MSKTTIIFSLYGAMAIDLHKELNYPLFVPASSSLDNGIVTYCNAETIDNDVNVRIGIRKMIYDSKEAVNFKEQLLRNGYYTR